MEKNTTDRVAEQLDPLRGTAGCDMKAQREATFDELGIEQKIARLRDAVLTLAGMGERATAQSSEANRLVKEHDHGSGGQVVVPLEVRRAWLEGDWDLTRGVTAAMEGGEGPFRRVQRLLG